MFSRSKPIRAIPLFSQSPKLPENFAEKLIDLETQIGFDLTVPLVSSLMQLYSVWSNQSAIEYYESIQDKRYLHYKDRLQTLLSRKDVLAVLSGPDTKSPQPAIKLSPESRSPDVLRNRFSRRNDDISVRKEAKGSAGGREARPHTVNLNLPVAKINPDQAISEHLQESSTASTIARDSIRKQEGDKLQERLQARRRANSLKPQKIAKDNSPRESKLELFQKEIENIMEKYAEDKIHKLQDIQKRYSQPGTPYTDPDSGIKPSAESSMKQEIESMQKEIFLERQAKIDLLRHKYETK